MVFTSLTEFKALGQKLSRLSLSVFSCCHAWSKQSCASSPRFHPCLRLGPQFRIPAPPAHITRADATASAQSQNRPPPVRSPVPLPSLWILDARQVRLRLDIPSASLRIRRLGSALHGPPPPPFFLHFTTTLRFNIEFGF